MADTIRQRIVTAIQTALSGISIANGYKTDVGARVYVWHVTPYGDDQIPCVNLFDRVCETERHLSGRHHHKLRIEIVVTALGTSTDSDLRKMIGDVIKVMGANRKWGGLAYDTDPQSDEIVVEQGDRRRGGANLVFVVHFRTEPYNAEQNTN